MRTQPLQKRLEHTLARYVAMPTATGNISACKEAIVELTDELTSLGLTVSTNTERHPWLIATADPTAHQRKHVKVLLVVHFDVVEATDPKQYLMSYKGDKLLGRGVFDMKFAMACYTELFRDLAAEGVLNAYDMGILITTDEERGGFEGARAFLDQGWSCGVALIEDGGGDWKVERQAKGLYYVYLESKGRSAHSSRTWEGRNPLPGMARALDEIIAYFPNNPEGTVVSVNTLATTNSMVMNCTQTPSWAKAGISIRAYTDEEMAEAYAFIQKVAQKHGLETLLTLKDPTTHIMKEYPLVQTFLDTLSEIRGVPTEFVDSLGASDARHFAAFDIPTVVLYPTGGNLHGHNEWVKRDDLSLYYKIVDAYLQKVALDQKSYALARVRHIKSIKKVESKAKTR